MARIRPEVLKVAPYSPGKPIDEVKRELGLDRVVKLASNENPFGPSPKAVAAIRDAAARIHVYPDGAAYDLKGALSRKFGMPRESIMVGNGSDELIHLLGLILMDEDGELIMADPGFARYDPSAHLAGATLTKVPVDADFRHDLNAMANAITDRTRMVFIANPNNPTGTILTKAELERFFERVPPGVVVVMDEAYLEFARDAEDMPNGLDFLRQGRDVVVLRTFSKAYGLAGIRIGYGFASPEIVDAYQRAREPFNTNVLAQIGAIAALDDVEHLEKTVANNTAGLHRLSALFTQLGARPVASHANFAYVDLGRDAFPVYEGLLRKGVITRAGAHVGHPRCLRVSVGTPEEMDIFESAFRETYR